VEGKKPSGLLHKVDQAQEEMGSEEVAQQLEEASCLG
jgi:hypothetical protein